MAENILQLLLQSCWLLVHLLGDNKFHGLDILHWQHYGTNILLNWDNKQDYLIQSSVSETLSKMVSVCGH